MSFSKNNIVNIHVYELLVNYARKIFEINNIIESMLKKLTFIINDNYCEKYSLSTARFIIKTFFKTKLQQGKNT